MKHKFKNIKKHKRNRWLHAFQEKAELQAKINAIDDMLIGWLVRKKRSTDV